MLAYSSPELAAAEVGDVEDAGVDLGAERFAFSCQNEAQGKREGRGGASYRRTEGKDRGSNEA